MMHNDKSNTDEPRNDQEWALRVSGAERERRKMDAEAASRRTRELVREAHLLGVSVYRLHQLTGVSVSALREWIGKSR